MSEPIQCLEKIEDGDAILVVGDFSSSGEDSEKIVGSLVCFLLEKFDLSNQQCA